MSASMSARILACMLACVFGCVFFGNLLTSFHVTVRCSHPSLLMEDFSLEVYLAMHTCDCDGGDDDVDDDEDDVVAKLYDDGVDDDHDGRFT